MAMNMAEQLRLEKLQRDFAELQRLEQLKKDEEAKQEALRAKKAAMMTARADWQSACDEAERTRLQHNAALLPQVTYEGYKALDSKFKQLYIQGLGEPWLASLKAASAAGMSLRDYEKLQGAA